MNASTSRCRAVWWRGRRSGSNVLIVSFLFFPMSKETKMSFLNGWGIIVEGLRNEAKPMDMLKHTGRWDMIARQLYGTTWDLCLSL